MIALAIDTTNQNLSIALIKNNEIFSKCVQIGKSGHSSQLMPIVDEMLSSHSVSVNQLDVVGVVVGPGSFTGIRIGVACMTAIAFATGAKRVAITSFDIIAYNRDSAICGVDAGHGNLYVANSNDGNILSTQFVEAKDAKSVVGVEFAPLDTPHDTLAKVFAKKIGNGEYVNVFEPFYMRKSQAEREKDEV